jgi:hypothetical protein
VASTRSRRGRAGGLALGVVLLPACYTYTPVATAPPPAARLALVLNDVGRVGAASQVGASAARVEGTVVDLTDTAYVLQVAEVRSLFGGRSRWAGERVTIRRDHVSAAMERRFSPGRSAVLGMLVGGALVALVTSGNLTVFGLGDGGEDGGPTDGEQHRVR